MQIIDGKQVASQVLEEVGKDIARLREQGITPGLAVVLVGEDPASQVYVNSKVKKCAELGMNSRKIVLSADASQEELLQVVRDLNADPSIHGILVQSPPPPHIDEAAVVLEIDPAKDVDGFHPENVAKLVLEDETGFVPSASKDGALVEAVCKHFGLDSVRGSSGRRGALAYMEMMRKVQEGDVCFCLTPDGPQGPIYQVHHGIIKMASQSGLPIVPVCIEYESCWRLNKAWDRYAIPKPCSNVNILWKKRLFIPPDATDEQVADYARLLAGLLSEGLPDFPPLNQSLLCKSSTENR